jgi:small subunit ribosomal protein S16
MGRNEGLPKPGSLLSSALFFGKHRDSGSGLAGAGQVRTAKNEPTTLMAVKIRLKRIGAKNKPAFRIVVADSRSPRDGKCIEELGSYLPQKKSDKFTLDLERAKYWLSKGAQPSETVASFIKKASKAVA